MTYYKGYQREYYLKNRERILKRIKEYSSTPKFKADRKIYNGEYASKNPQKIKDSFNKWYKNNSGRVIACAKRWRNRNPLTSQFFRYKERAKQKELPFEFTREEFTNLILEDCTYCGFPKPMGADRLDSSKGYTKENTFPCCKNCNRMKLDHSLEDFLIHIKNIVTFLDI